MHKHHHGSSEALAHPANPRVEVPVTIQPGGCLLSLDPGLTRVLQVSANLPEVIGVVVADALAQSPGQLLGAPLVRQLQASLAAADGAPLILRRPLGGRVAPFQVNHYVSDGRVVLEIEPLAAARDLRLARAGQWLARLTRAASQEALLGVLCAGLRAITGYERVLVQRFDSGGAAEILAHESAPGLAGQPPSVLHIPPRARYHRNPLRSIPDALAEPVPLVPPQDPEGAAPLDLSAGVLRAASPAHRHYLLDRGLGSSLSLAIHDAGGVWGLAICQSTRPRWLSPRCRDAALALVRLATQQLLVLWARAEADFRHQVLASREQLAAQRDRLASLGEWLGAQGESWRALFGARGLALVHGGAVSRCGLTPQPRVLRRISRALDASHRVPGPWWADAPGAAPLEEVADTAWRGLLAAPLAAGSPRDWLLLFRDPPPTGAGCPWRTFEQQAAADLAGDLAVTAAALRIDRLDGRLRNADRHLAEAAHTDTLTHCWNRYRIELELDRELSAAERYGRPCALLLFEVDRFEQVNDRCGEGRRDRLLTTLAATVAGNLRPTDHLGRWGEGVFMVVAGNTRLDGALGLAERLRAAAAGIDLDGVGSATISIGIAERAARDSGRSLVARASRALCRAKGAGGDRAVTELVVTAPGPS